ncbi:MAG: acyl-CoA dehydrogenase [Acidimicrobiales bacterium]|nr:acyl-CoA dehydrogenase [Acidimicrobiales bacterium]
MPLGVSDDHLALHAAASRWASDRCPPAVPRSLLDRDDEPLPEFWGELAGLGWLGLHIDEAHGGEGYGLGELAVVLEELGRVCAPGPFLPTVLTSSLIQRHGTATQRDRWLPGLADGSVRGAVAFGAGVLTNDAGAASERPHASGTLRPVLGGGLAELFVVPVEIEGREHWYVVDRGEVDVTLLPSLDPTRRVAAVTADGAALSLDAALVGVTRRHVLDLAVTLLAAESVGGAAWCLDTAAGYAKVREQFGRPIGQFQAVKHRCADLLLSLEQARAAAWDAAREADEGAEDALAAAVAGALVPEAYAAAAKDCIQVLGGIGFTWEHDAHLYLKRSMAVRALTGGAGPWRRRVADLAAADARRSLAVELPEGHDEIRAEVRRFVAETTAADKAEWTPRMADAGYLVPYWPPPWGRGAGPVEQLVIDEEFAAAKLRRPHLQVGAWVLPTLIAHGTPDQQERWIPGTLRGEISWCQMFSEPGAGSDLASLTTRAQRAEGGWLLTGQKVWTTLAHQADFAICLARTNPDRPKHDGITCFIVDMDAEGLDIRPLRELTGHEMFNEVFLDEVFVPDDAVVGAVDDGWRAARTTLENERVSMGSGPSFGPGVENLLRLALGGGHADDPVVLDQLGALLAEGQSLAVLGLRTTLRALAGAEPGPESSVRKLLGVEHEQRVQEAGLALLGDQGAVVDGEAGLWIAGFLGNRCLTIAGGTSEVQRNVIAERLLGLPRDPEPTKEH